MIGKPKDLHECFLFLDGLLIQEDKNSLKNKTIDLVSLHHSLGRYIRNKWGLWEESFLFKWFGTIGVEHADDMSAIILESYVKYLRGEDLELEKQIEKYQKFWEENNYETK